MSSTLYIRPIRYRDPHAGSCSSWAAFGCVTGHFDDLVEGRDVQAGTIATVAGYVG